MALLAFNLTLEWYEFCALLAAVGIGIVLWKCQIPKLTSIAYRTFVMHFGENAADSPQEETIPPPAPLPPPARQQLLLQDDARPQRTLSSSQRRRKKQTP